jgi:hypothetical protein
MSHTPEPVITSAWVTAFIDYGLYLRGWSVRTSRTYQQGLATPATTPLTEDTILINKKHLPQEVQQSCLHIIIASNAEKPLHIERDDRRYFVLRVSEARKNKVQYFTALTRALPRRS